jgi:hypothetical protein
LKFVLILQPLSRTVLVSEFPGSSGYTYSFNNTIVQFGVGVSLSGSAISIWSPTTISVVSVLLLIPISVQVQVSVETPLGRSKGASVQLPYHNTNRIYCHQVGGLWSSY